MRHSIMSVYKTSPGKKHKERFINRQQAHQNNALLDSKTNAAFSSYEMDGRDGKDSHVNNWGVFMSSRWLYDYMSWPCED